MNMIKQGIAGILCCAQLALGAVVFEEPFDGLADGTLNGKNGWLASPSGDVLVQGDVTHDGSAKSDQASYLDAVSIVTTKGLVSVVR